MRMRLILSVLLVLLVTASFVLSARVFEQPSISQRPSSVSATILNSPKLYGGSYAGGLKSRICGETDPMYTGARNFVFEYPDIDDPRAIKGITDVTFSSADLVGGATVTGNFHVSITVSPSGVGGSPPAYVVDTRIPGRGSGKATLAVNGGSLELTIVASDPLQQELRMKITCGPK